MKTQTHTLSLSFHTHPTAPFARPGACTCALYRGGKGDTVTRSEGREGANGDGDGDGNGVGGRNGNVDGDGGGGETAGT